MALEQVEGGGGGESLIILRTPSSDQWTLSCKLKERRNIGPRPYFSGTSKQNNIQLMKIYWAPTCIRCYVVYRNTDVKLSDVSNNLFSSQHGQDERGLLRFFLEKHA